MTPAASAAGFLGALFLLGVWLGYIVGRLSVNYQRLDRGPVVRAGLFDLETAGELERVRLDYKTTDSLGRSVHLTGVLELSGVWGNSRRGSSAILRQVSIESSPSVH